MIEILMNMPKYILTNDGLIYNSIYVLIKNNYLQESQAILEKIIKSKSNKLFINTLQNAINNQLEYNKLSEEQKVSYQTAIEYGHIYYQEENIEQAYDLYTYGLYVTGNNIFLYYIGKMLYKAGNYKEAEIYLKEYIKEEIDKLAKAYLYLGWISIYKWDYKKAKYYSNKSDELNKLYGTNFISSIYDINNPETDPTKLNLQKAKRMYSINFKAPNVD